MQKWPSLTTQLGTTLLAFIWFLVLGSPAFATIINGTTVANNQLTITGTGFSGTPLTVTLNATNLAVVSNTATKIVATLGTVPAPGTYRLVVKAGNAVASAYVGISAAPNVVAQVVLTGQNTGINSTPIITPTTDGLYLVTAYMAEVVAGNTNGYWTFGLYWQDDGVGQRATYLGVPCNQPSSQFGVFPMKLKAGVPLMYNVTDSNGSGQYELRVSVEQLQ